MFQCSGKIKEKAALCLWVLFSQTLIVPASLGLETVMASCPPLLKTGQLAVATSAPEMLRDLGTEM